MDNLRTLRYANLDGAFATAFATVVGGSFIVGFIKMLGGSDLWIGLVTAVPSLLGIFQIPGGILGRSWPNYKGWVLPGGLLWRVFYIPLAFLPVMVGPADLKLALMVICIGVASLAVLLVNPVYNDWLAEMVPASSRGWFFSRRTAIATSVGAAAGMLGGLALDYFRRLGEEPLGFSLIFGFGSLCAAMSFFFFLKMKDLPRDNPVKQNLWDGVRAIRSPFSDAPFRRVLVFLVLFIAGQAFAGNLFSAFALETLELPFATIQMLGVAHALAMTLTVGIWGFLADKYGNRPLLGILGSGLVLTPVMWLFCHPGKDQANTIILMAGHLFTGFIWGGIATTQFNLLLATAKPEDRANYLGAGMATQALVGGVAPLIGAALMAALRTNVETEVAYKIVFGTAMGLRFVSLFALAGVQETGSRSFRETLTHLSRVSPKGAQAFKRYSQSGDERARETAIREVAKENYALAGSEVVKALHDPSPRVRRQAAMALGKLGDSRSIAELIHMLENHPDLVEEETIEALGELGGPQAVEVLMKFLESPRSLLRRASAKALGRIGDLRAIDPLSKAAGEQGDPDLRRASLQALRILGASSAADAICDALLDQHPSVRIAAAEAVSELELFAAGPFLRQSLERYNDEAASEVAYALGCLGDPTDLPIILAEAQQSVSMITRRRCLLGVARMFVCESEVYRMFLADGFERDQALMEALKPALRVHPELREALVAYSSGDECGAVGILAATGKIPALQFLVDQCVEDAFVVAALALASRRKEHFDQT